MNKAELAKLKAQYEKCKAAYYHKPETEPNA